MPDFLSLLQSFTLFAMLFSYHRTVNRNSMDTLNICLKNGGKVQEYIDVEPIKDIDSLIKELNQYLTYKDIDIFTKVINESLVESELEKGKIC